MSNESFVHKAAETTLPTPFGEFRAIAFVNDIDDFEHLALVQSAKTLSGELISANRYGSFILGDGDNTLEAHFTNILANHQAIHQLIKVKQNDLEQIHQIAQTFGMVSPYSSYIALITDSQKKQLKKDSQKDNKFTAGYDRAEENIDPSQPSIFKLPVIPEPDVTLTILPYLRSTM